jgi:hypothetical protein
MRSGVHRLGVPALLAIAANGGCGSPDGAPPITYDAGSGTDERREGEAGLDSTLDSTGEDEPGNAMADGSTDAGSDAPRAPTCPIQTIGPAPAGAARSAGYSGTDAQYYGLYDVACQSAGDCALACVQAGGTTASCAEASDCPSQGVDGAKSCVPPTYWLSAKAALRESGSTMDSAMLILVTLDYHDAIELTKFGVSIPDDATITGIQFKVRRNADTMLAVDEAVRILKNGAPVGVDHRQTGRWPATLDYATYGDAYDTWGVSWTPADIRSTDFGISIAPRYTDMAGNDRAHIDSARVTVFYTVPCD